MFLLDTSVWINVFSKKPSIQISTEQIPLIVTCPLVIQELLQGIKDDITHKRFKDEILAFPCLDSSLPLERFVTAADLFRSARRRGISIRSSVDCLIAAIALHHDVTVVHLDRDYDLLSRFCDLKTVNALL